MRVGHSIVRYAIVSNNNLPTGSSIYILWCSSPFPLSGLGCERVEVPSFITGSCIILNDVSSLFFAVQFPLYHYRGAYPDQQTCRGFTLENHRGCSHRQCFPVTPLLPLVATLSSVLQKEEDEIHRQLSVSSASFKLFIKSCLSLYLAIDPSLCDPLFKDNPTYIDPQELISSESLSKSTSKELVPLSYSDYGSSSNTTLTAITGDTPRSCSGYHDCMKEKTVEDSTKTDHD